jgi:hypothetical protein
MAYSIICGFSPLAGLPALVYLDTVWAKVALSLLLPLRASIAIGIPA